MRPGPPSPELLVAAAGGDEAAMGALMTAWAPVVLGWCKRLGGPRVDPHDAAQDVLIVLMDHVGRVYGPDVFRSWLFGVTRRVIQRHRRSGWVKAWMGGLIGERPDAGPGPHRVAELSDTARRVQAVLESLPAHYREVLVLCDLEERTDEEAAELLEVPVGTVKSRLRRGRERFKKAARSRGLGEIVLPEASSRRSA